MMLIREATGDDAPGIRDIFLACYGNLYPFPEFFDLRLLNRTIYSEANLLLVAEDTATGRLVGTASVILEAGAFSDLVGEFGRLAVHPDARGAGLGSRLMEERLVRVKDRLHVGLVEARVVQPQSLKIAEAQGFQVAGFMPLKLGLQQRESLVLLVRYFGNALELRRNHPRVISEVYDLAHLSLSHGGLPQDAIVDEQAAPYPAGSTYTLRELTTEGYSSLLRIERGRVKRREILGPLQLHYGLFKLQARQSQYLLAEDGNRIVGAIGYTLDTLDRSARVFELISLHDEVISFLLHRLVHICEAAGIVEYLEADVSAHAPRMQRTLSEMGFLPAAYVPAMAFQDVERVDVVKMCRLLKPQELGTLALSHRAEAMADTVLRHLRNRTVLPQVAKAVRELALFASLNDEQTCRLAGVCRVATFPDGVTIYREGDADQSLYIILSGEVAVSVPDGASAAGLVKRGECLGELSLLSSLPHSATAVARTRVEAAILGHRELVELIRLRPDIGVLIYRNLAAGLGEKLKRATSLAARDE